jgi:hypothetical protein
MEEPKLRSPRRLFVKNPKLKKKASADAENFLKDTAKTGS